MKPKTKKGAMRHGKGPKNMDYDVAEELDKADDEDEDDEEEEEEEEAEKALIGGNDLIKAMSDYDAVQGSYDDAGDDRGAYLEARLTAGTLTKSERTELGKIWSGETVKAAPPPPPLRKSLTENLSELGDGSDELVDASDFLKSLVDSIDTSLDDVITGVSRDGRATRQLLKAQGSLIKSLATHNVQLGRIVKSLSQRLEVVETTPAPARGVTAATGRRRPLAKSALGSPGEGGDDSLSKSEIFKALRSLVVKASESGNETVAGRLANATAKFESTGQIDEPVLNAVKQELAAA